MSVKWTWSGAAFAGLGAVASIVTVLQYVYPLQQAPAAAENKISTSIVESQAKAPVEVVSKKEVTEAVEPPKRVIPIAQAAGSKGVAQKAEPAKLGQDTEVAVTPAVKRPPSCLGSTWADTTGPIEVREGQEVCDETGRLLATVKHIYDRGYFGGGIYFERPGTTKELRCYRMKTCQFPWTGDATFIIERVIDKFGDEVAVLRLQ